jgi:hypothetical protein
MSLYAAVGSIFGWLRVDLSQYQSKKPVSETLR